MKIVLKNKRKYHNLVDWIHSLCLLKEYYYPFVVDQLLLDIEDYEDLKLDKFLLDVSFNGMRPLVKADLDVDCF